MCCVRVRGCVLCEGEGVCCVCVRVRVCVV